MKRLKQIDDTCKDLTNIYLQCLQRHLYTCCNLPHKARTRLLFDRYSIAHDPHTTIHDYSPTSTRQPIRSLLDQPDPYTAPTRSLLDQLDRYSISIRSRPDQIELVVLGS